VHSIAFHCRPRQSLVVSCKSSQLGRNMRIDHQLFRTFLSATPLAGCSRGPAPAQHMTCTAFHCVLLLRPCTFVQHETCPFELVMGIHPRCSVIEDAGSLYSPGVELSAEYPTDGDHRASACATVDYCVPLLSIVCHLECVSLLFIVDPDSHWLSGGSRALREQYAN
jgi:hypothetical protein